MNRLMRTFAAFLLAYFLTGCASINSVYNRDPLTGGVNTGISPLLHCPVPGGMQIYPSHSYAEQGPTGVSQGLETYRGAVNATTCGIAMHNTLKQNGWQLRLSLRQGGRYLYLYAKGDERCVITLRSQGILTIMEIWLGAALPDGAELHPSTSNLPSEPKIENFETFEDNSANEENFGIEEKDL